MDRTKASVGQDGGDTEQVIASELVHLLESPMFVRSPVLSRLLQYLVDHRLQGNRAAPKAYAIATEALGRSADFDPAVDSYPRVMVGRLRSLLDRYYSEKPWLHRLRVPQGSYEVVVQYRAAPPGARGGDAGEAPPGEEAGAAAAGAPPPAGSAASGASSLLPPMPRPRARWLWLGFVVALLLAALAGWLAARSSGSLLGSDFVPMPTIEVSQPVAGETGPSRAMARALDSKLRDGLRRFELIQLLAARDPKAASTQLRADYRLDASLVRTLQGPVDVTLVLNRVADERAIWSQQIRLTDQDIPEFTGIEPAIAQVAGDYGVVVRDQLQRQPDNYASGFPCLAQFNRTLQMRNPERVRRVDRCLRATLVDLPQDPVPLAALSLLRFGDWQPQRTTDEGKKAFAEAQLFAKRAYDAGPTSAAGLFAMARAHFYRGECGRGAVMGEAAVALNRYDADLTGFLGLFKAACGDREDGAALLARSVALDASHPGVPAVTLAFLRSQQGDQAAALALLDSLPSPSNLEPQYLMVRSIVLARMGEVEQGRRVWRRLLDYTHQPASASPERVLGRFMISPAVIATASDALRQSGVVGAGAAAGPKPGRGG